MNDVTSRVEDGGSARDAEGPVLALPRGGAIQQVDVPPARIVVTSTGPVPASGSVPSRSAPGATTTTAAPSPGRAVHWDTVTRG